MLESCFRTCSSLAHFADFSCDRSRKKILQPSKLQPPNPDCFVPLQQLKLFTLLVLLLFRQSHLAVMACSQQLIDSDELFLI